MRKLVTVHDYPFLSTFERMLTNNYRDYVKTIVLKYDVVLYVYFVFSIFVWPNWAFSSYSIRKISFTIFDLVTSNYTIRNWCNYKF
jgi:hypothetical protein